MITGTAPQLPEVVRIYSCSTLFRFLELDFYLFRHLELVDCICAGTVNVMKNDEALVFAAPSPRSCRDVLYPHTRTKACDLLDSISSSVTLDAG